VATGLSCSQQYFPLDCDSYSRWTQNEHLPSHNPVSHVKNAVIVSDEQNRAALLFGELLHNFHAVASRLFIESSAWLVS
jgi:hypothetical protein